MKSKIDQIWDLVLEFDESENDITGKISYGKKEGGTGRLSVTLDGRRVTVYVEADDEQE